MSNKHCSYSTYTCSPSSKVVSHGQPTVSISNSSTHIAPTRAILPPTLFAILRGSYISLTSYPLLNVFCFISNLYEWHPRFTACSTRMTANTSYCHDWWIFWPNSLIGSDFGLMWRLTCIDSNIRVRLSDRFQDRPRGNGTEGVCSVILYSGFICHLSGQPSGDTTWSISIKGP